ncbi:hypothetical protein A3K48_07705 [candidate division WOR-1 bacterium RIFOXYA12_FULL_52_29]|uniref:Uncharacterized protein n=1 Tax=candidate division WOR-1 bacterium RIFOXYC12_FULL_54_18 TaxID=1802584 RepID=A0A1F4T7S8_UNCSA|nr:MAG: hypothetical protein A3K44_07705 [candidate division WOR-1 bacterium RIFOXYA2_FULL_51_19]OGC18395.1 MAG: hypothetical protein A3K48_07705 [candidate division WOR-1 bacterium RIFOXYA12_FULL_52_29]OGC27250.1 MAG: hypothetical protein A3K32_07700 [candidate division WOR-1 bacterium RIFOXYB2_FULL_45_9]OGC28812.1 MAG: hypothetical protein A3K49_07705 [candidate division WOR-1 bacterium RIFOXYC12_FULL_54_18]OGC30734.1 MAG: hypothetical protein A2346_04910 [candidate division WOR-1 bacterium R
MDKIENAQENVLNLLRKECDNWVDLNELFNEVPNAKNDFTNVDDFFKNVIVPLQLKNKIDVDSKVKVPLCPQPSQSPQNAPIIRNLSSVEIIQVRIKQ